MTNSFYPVIMSKNIEESAGFFKTNFCFKETFKSDWYISLKADEGFELAIIDGQHDTIPSDYKGDCKGVILNFEVDDVDKVHSRMVSNPGVKILKDVKNEDFGQRHFIIESPDKILIDVIQIIPPTEEFLSQYTDVDSL